MSDADCNPQRTQGAQFSGMGCFQGSSLVSEALELCMEERFGFERCKGDDARNVGDPATGSPSGTLAAGAGILAAFEKEKVFMKAPDDPNV